MDGVKVRLRAMEPADADVMFNWENNPDTWTSGDRRWPVSMNDIHVLIEHSDLDIWQTRQLRLMIESKADGLTIGCVDIFKFDPLNMHCALGIYICPDHRNSGCATEAVQLMEKMAFETFDVHSIIVDIEDDNEASIALFNKLGYTEVGRMKQWLRKGYEFADQLIMQKINLLHIQKNK